MERRQHRRVPVQVQGFLLGNSHETEAVTLDLSVGGARFDCDLEVYPGKVIRVRLVLPGAEEVVSVSFRIDVACASANKATVRPAH